MTQSGHWWTWIILAAQIEHCAAMPRLVTQLATEKALISFAKKPALRSATLRATAPRGWPIWARPSESLWRSTPARLAQVAPRAGFRGLKVTRRKIVLRRVDSHFAE